jgi:hypothetical protein
MPLYRLKSGILDTPDAIPPLFAPFVTPLMGPFVVGQPVVSPRDTETPLVVLQVGPVDFNGITGYLCHAVRTPNDHRWYAETDLVATS